MIRAKREEETPEGGAPGGLALRVTEPSLSRSLVGSRKRYYSATKHRFDVLHGISRVEGRFTMLRQDTLIGTPQVF